VRHYQEYNVKEKTCEYSLSCFFSLRLLRSTESGKATEKLLLTIESDTVSGRERHRESDKVADTANLELSLFLRGIDDVSLCFFLSHACPPRFRESVSPFLTYMLPMLIRRVTKL
jgi:hypothetical protein